MRFDTRKADQTTTPIPSGTSTATAITAPMATVLLTDVCRKSSASPIITQSTVGSNGRTTTA